MIRRSTAATTIVVGLAVLLAAPAAATESIQMRDNRYTPTLAQVAQGESVSWTNFGQVVHDSVDDSGLELFSTDIAAPPDTVSIGPLPGAGRYVYYCTFHPEMRGRLDVPVTVSRATVGRGGEVTVRWARRQPPGDLVFDVQRRRPGTSAFAPWRTGIGADATRWWPNVRGTWTIRARVRNADTGEASAWSAPTPLRVTA